LQGVDVALTLAQYGDRVEHLLKTLIHNGRGIEINCSGIRDGCGPFPSEEILRLYRSLGGEIITIGSDAHRPEDAAKCVDVGQEILKACGFRYITTFTKHKPEFISI
jgi:histidinol-phosphatase (PHP family)